jgi:hypothetical protein
VLHGGSQGLAQERKWNHFGCDGLRLEPNHRIFLEPERMPNAPHRTHPIWSLGAALERLMLQACLSFTVRGIHAGQDKVS